MTTKRSNSLLKTLNQIESAPGALYHHFIGNGRSSSSSLVPSPSGSLTNGQSNSDNSFTCLSLYPKSGNNDNMRNNEVRTVMLHGVPIVALVMDNAERLCLAQISNTLLKNFSYNEIHNRRVALGITCVQCTPVQLELLRRAGAMPVSSRRCGMITKREAERLCKSFLAETAPPKLPDSFSFDIHHQCAWGCRGAFNPSRYNSSRAKCIKCCYCGLFFSPNKFIFHSHRLPESKYVQPDAANFNSWRRHIKLYGSPPDEIMFAWEDVKAMFNGGSRKRAMAASLTSVSKQQQQKRQQAQQQQQQQQQQQRTRESSQDQMSHRMRSPSPVVAPSSSKRCRLSCGSSSSASPPEASSPNIAFVTPSGLFSGDKSSPPTSSSSHLQSSHHHSLSGHNYSTLPSLTSPYPFPFLPKSAYGALIQGLTAASVGSSFPSSHALNQSHSLQHPMHPLGLIVPEGLGFPSASGSGQKASSPSASSLGIVHPDVRQTFAEFMGTQPSLLPYNYLQLSKYWPRPPASLESVGPSSSASSSSSSSRSSSGMISSADLLLSPRSHQGSSLFPTHPSHLSHQQRQLVSNLMIEQTNNGHPRDSPGTDTPVATSFFPSSSSTSSSCMEKAAALAAVAAAVVSGGGSHASSSSWDSSSRDLNSRGSHESRTSISGAEGLTHATSTAMTSGSAFKPLAFNRNNSATKHSSCFNNRTLNSSSFRAENLISGTRSEQLDNNILFRTASRSSQSSPPSDSVKSEGEEDDGNEDEVDVIGGGDSGETMTPDRGGAKFISPDTSSSGG